MKFVDFIQRTKRTEAQAADELGVSTECIRLWKLGKRIPRRRNMVEIRAWSRGKVTPNDWISTDNPAG